MLRAERERRGYSVQHAAEDMHLDAWVIAGDRSESLRGARRAGVRDGAPAKVRGAARPVAGDRASSATRRSAARRQSRRRFRPRIRHAGEIGASLACRSCRCGSSPRSRWRSASRGSCSSCVRSRYVAMNTATSALAAPAVSAAVVSEPVEQRRPSQSRRQLRAAPVAAATAATAAAAKCVCACEFNERVVGRDLRRRLASG